MKIAFFTDSYLPSADGVATSVDASARELRRRGHTVYVVAPRQPGASSSKNVYRLLSVRLLKTPEVWVALDVPEPSLFKVTTMKVDIVHGHSGGPVSFLGWQMARLHRVPFVETYHTLWRHYKHYLPYHKIFKIWMIKKFTAFIGNDCDAVITPSEKAKLDLLSDGVKKPIYIVPNGIDLYKYRHQGKSYLHEKYKIPTGKKIVFTAGRLEKEKSIDFLINSIAVAGKKDPDIILVIAGKGSEKERLIKLAESRGISDRVYFIGLVPINDMSKAYSSADIFAFASRTESQGMVIIEALASGLPVVTVDDTAFRNVITNGENGYLVEKEISIFAKTLTGILKDDKLRVKMSHEARISSHRFSIHKTTEVLEQAYLEIMHSYHKTKKYPISHNPAKRTGFLNRS